MNSLIVKFILSMVRHALTFGGGVEVANGTMSANDASQLVGALMTIIGIAWSLWEKHTQHEIIKRAELVKLPDDNQP